MSGIVDVANAVGVSPATVSRALRGLPGVAPATRAAIERAAEQLGYVASPTASGLPTGRSGAIGILAPWLSRWFFAAAIEGVQRTLHENNYDVLLYPAGAGVVRGAGHLDVRALHKRVDGIVALNVPVGIDSLADFRIPVVTVGGSYHGMCSVAVDDVEVGRAATAHLIAHGHRVISCLGDDPDRIYGFRAAVDRIAGYRNALRAHGIAEIPELVEVTGFSIAGGAEGLRRQWNRARAGEIPFPTAVFAVSDEVAMGVLHAARELGIRVPEQLSVIGVDNHDMAYLFDLSTVAQPVRDQGALAASLLLEQIRVPDAEPTQLVVPTELIARGSTGPNRASGSARADRQQQVRSLR